MLVRYDVILQFAYACNITAYLTNTAEDQSNLIRNIQLLINCVKNMHSLFGITFVLFIVARVHMYLCVMPTELCGQVRSSA